MMHIVPPLWMGIPFLVLLIMIAVGPYALPRLWHRLEVLFLIGLSLVTLGGLCKTLGMQETFHHFFHMLLHEYIPFVMLLSALYSITMGFRLQLKSVGTPFKNTLFLGFGAILASFVGTTGASMILLRSFLHMNRHRSYQTHSVIFFIFLVSNIGGCLTPIGDPPLFLGYLNGVEFFWSLQFLWQPFFVVTALLLAFYFLLDGYLYKRDFLIPLVHPEKNGTVFQGKINLLLLAILILLVVGSGTCLRWFPDLPIITLGEQHLRIPELVRDGGLCLLTLGAVFLSKHRSTDPKHTFSWSPVYEVVRIFAAIFTAIIPLNLMLEAGFEGPLSSLLQLTEVSYPALVYFWLTGLFSAFLDNAPTYLIFFKMAGGDAVTLMTTQAKVLMAISLGSVFMGAMTYIGNAPNFMVRSIAKQSGVSMPGFLGYMGWSLVILLPLFLGVSLCLFR